LNEKRKWNADFYDDDDLLRFLKSFLILTIIIIIKISVPF